MTQDSITAERLVPLSPEAAFDRWTAGFADWWPREHCFCGEDRLDRVFLDPARGVWGEVDSDGQEALWGAVLEACRPGLLRLGWQMDARPSPWIPEPDPDRASIVTVEIVPEGAGARLRVTHSDFARHGDSAAPMRAVMIGMDRWAEWLEDYARGL
ncbi:MAG: SRPBCC domain-containing protein [Rhodobacteraceae bacterium]|nr:SRPBCC domain-containing protein [Paracoccaceae bacterium]